MAEKSLNFKEWLKLNEVGTSTGDVASFKRISLPMVRRQWFGPWASEDPFFKKKKSKRD